LLLTKIGIKLGPILVFYLISYCCLQVDDKCLNTN
jgi:hypothetical protein